MPLRRPYRAVVIFVTRFAQLEKIRSSRSAGTRVDVFEVRSILDVLGYPFDESALFTGLDKIFRLGIAHTTRGDVGCGYHFG